MDKVRSSSRRKAAKPKAAATVKSCSKKTTPKSKAGKIKNSSSKRSTKSKDKGKMIMPRLRLEPRLKPEPSVSHENTEENTRSLNNGVVENSFQPASPHDPPASNNSDVEEKEDSEISEDDESSNYEPEENDDSDWEEAFIKKAKKKPAAKRKSKSKPELTVGPRLRLEPRLNPKSVNEGNTQGTEDSRQETEDMPTFSRMNDETSSSQSTLPIDLGSRMSSGGKENENPQASTASSIPDFEEDWENVTVKKRQKRHVRRSFYWNDRELMDLAIGFQSEGFSDFKKVADYVKTKNDNDISAYIVGRTRTKPVRPNQPDVPNEPKKKKTRWCTATPENVATWSNARKWKKLAYQQMLGHTRTKDYSQPVISALFQRFYEEEEEPADPQVINVKLIYKYLMDCISGSIPAQLPPKESALVLDLLREVRSMPIVYDFEEELQFLNGFKSATKFKPFHVKDEFKKNIRKDKDDDDPWDPNAVPVPEQVFLDLSRHKKLVQSFNPMVIPLWFMQREQEHLKEYFEESNVYVD